MDLKTWDESTEATIGMDAAGAKVQSTEPAPREARTAG